MKIRLVLTFILTTIVVGAALPSAAQAVSIKCSEAYSVLDQASKKYNYIVSVGQPRMCQNQPKGGKLISSFKWGEKYPIWRGSMICIWVTKHQPFFSFSTRYHFVQRLALRQVFCRK